MPASPRNGYDEVIQSGLQFGMKFGNSALAYQAAIDGMGVAIAQRELVHDDLTAGRLVAAYPLVASNNEAYYLASAADAHGNEDAIAFREWILSKNNVGRPMSFARPAPAHGTVNGPV
jgi:LysR family glycine cleavage system transcriptional activator